MKLIYITSGYSKIYRFLDKCILKSIESINDMKVVAYDIRKGQSGLKALCRKFRPDVALTLIGDKLEEKTVLWLKNNHTKMLLWLTEDPYFIDRTITYIPFYDHVFTIDLGAYQFYQEEGHHHTSFLPLGTDSQVFSPKRRQKKYKSDICLIGYPYPNRVQLVSHILSETNYNLLVGGPWNHHFENSDRLTVIKGWIPPAKVANYYANANIVLNTHRHFQEEQNENSRSIMNKSINNRTFDIAACGAFQLINLKETLSLHFEPDKEILSFSDEKDLVNKIHFYMKHEEKRKAIGEQARNRVLQEHTFMHRMKTILEKA